MYFLCWDGKDYKITSKVQKDEVVQILCSQDEAKRALKMYADGLIVSDRH